MGMTKTPPEGSLTLKYNDKGLNVNIHDIIIILCKRNLLLHPQLLLMMVTGFRQVNWGFVPGMLELETSKTRLLFLLVSESETNTVAGYPPFLQAETFLRDHSATKTASSSLNFPSSGAKVPHNPYPSQPKSWVLDNSCCIPANPTAQGRNRAGGPKWCCWWELLFSWQITWFFITRGLIGLLLRP